MAISESNRAIIERYIGTLQEADLESVDARFARLGSALAVALEILLIRRGDLDAHPDRIMSEGIAIEIALQRKRLDESINRLVGVLNKETSLTAVVEDLLDQVAAGGDWTTTITVETRNTRRGG